jgi:hypothetical protein
MRIFYLIFIVTLAIPVWGQQNGLFQIVRVKYSGGGDWYNGPTEEPNLLNYIQAHTNLKVKAEYKFVDIASDEIFAYPFLFLTGHGNISFTDDEVGRLRKYLENGGFLYVDDDYGLDKFIRREMKKVFPDKDFIELPFNHKLYHIVYDFPSGPPKTHEHNGKPPQGFGIFIDKRLAVYYTYESNPSDGWDDPDVHGDPADKRDEALRFGTNLVIYALTK